MSSTAEIFRHLSHPLQPVTTDIAPHKQRLASIRVVLFDIYGTLVISGSGDIGTIDQKSRTAAMQLALESLPVPREISAEAVERELAATIARHHVRARHQGTAHPEVDIVEVWKETTNKMGLEGVDCPRLAVEFEARANPTWPMPHLEDCLQELHRREVALGLISNAQFFTPELFPALVNKSLDELNFDEQLRYYSFQIGEAKPSRRMYEMARDELAKRDIHSNQVLYVGNDMLNDILPASSVSFRTALFAGDSRSLRLREQDPRVADIQPDAILTSLSQIPEILDDRN